MTYQDEVLDEVIRQRERDGHAVAAIREISGVEYRSRFGNWQARASVRVKPERRLSSVDAAEIYFPDHLVPTATHPLVAVRGEHVTRRLLVHRLFHYLHFTSELEALAVIPIATKISRGRAGLSLPAGMRRDAFKIVTDEAWHAQFSYDLMEQVRTVTDVGLCLPDVPQFVERLAEIELRLDPRVGGLVALMFAVVSETLISGILSDVPRDRRLPPAVRELVADHAEDEGRHHAYFRVVLKHVWHAIDSADRAVIGPWLPEVIAAFLEPDYRALGYALAEAGLPPDEVEQIIAESHPRHQVRADVAAAAGATVRYFAEVGALDDARTAEAFAAAGLTGTPRPQTSCFAALKGEAR
jgi:hypothetical protein